MCILIGLDIYWIPNIPLPQCIDKEGDLFFWFGMQQYYNFRSDLDFALNNVSGEDCDKSLLLQLIDIV